MLSIMCTFAAYYVNGKSYYDLGIEFNKPKWGIALLGVLVFFIGTLLGGMLIYFCCGYFGYKPNDSLDVIGLELLSYLFGFLVSYLAYRMLEKQWSHPDLLGFEILDDDIINENKHEN